MATLTTSICSRNGTTTPPREQAFFPERAEGDVHWFDRNALFGLVLAI
jgi:hypothetical protein